MGRRVDYREALRSLPRSQWAAYLTEHSGLPGPRGNIELGQALADEADAHLVDELLATGDEYLCFCGVLGLGRQLAEGTHDPGVERRLRSYAADGRWRVREGVAMALQRLGDADLDRMLGLVQNWVGDDDPLVQRAAAAGVCEPRLLSGAAAAAVAVKVCDRATRALAARPAGQRRTDEIRVLRQGLGYCWSVAVAADPASGLPLFRALAALHDTDVDWIVRENSRKKRLANLL